MSKPKLPKLEAMPETSIKQEKLTSFQMKRNKIVLSEKAEKFYSKIKK